MNDKNIALFKQKKTENPQYDRFSVLFIKSQKL